MTQVSRHSMGGVAKLSIFLMFVSSTASWAQSAERENEVQYLNLSFAAPIAIEGVSSSENRNPTLVDVVRSNKNPTIFLAAEYPNAELLVGATRSSFGLPIPLPIKSYQLKITEGAEDTLWIGGARGAKVSIASTHLSYGYLAKVDRRGHLFWERDYGGETERSIQSITPLASGDVVVSGQDSDRTWLARISKDGNIVWERFVGIGKGSATTAIDGVGIITLAALEVCQCNESYREDVAVWSFDQAGELLDHRVIREGINRVPNQSAAQIRIETGKDSIYVLSVWSAFQAQPFEIARLDFRREHVWSKRFPKTVSRHGGFEDARFPTTVVLSNGDILFAMWEQWPTYVLSRLDAATGDLSTAVVRFPANPPPPCIERWAPILFMKEGDQNTVLLFGSPSDGQGSKVCSWIGEAAMPNSQR